MTKAEWTDPRIGVAGANKDRGKNPVRGVRVELDLWEDLKEQAEKAGTTRNAVIVALMRGYVDGKIKMPKG